MKKIYQQPTIEVEMMDCSQLMAASPQISGEYSDPELESLSRREDRRGFSVWDDDEDF